MISYYEFTKALTEHLQGDPEINTVTIGGFDDIDVNKQSIFGLAHILITDAEFIIGVVRFSVTISVMDLVDERKENINDIPTNDKWKGLSNKQDVLNTMLSVLERLDKAIKNDTLITTGGVEIVGTAVSVPFEERFENLLTGWSTDYVIDIPNTIQNC